MADLPDLPKTEAAIIEATNAFRASQRLGPVTRNPALDAAAREFARYLAKSGRFAHEADGRQPADRAKAAGYDYCSIAENLASHLDSRGFTSLRLAEEALEGWKASPGHRKNLLLPSVTEIGVGVAQAPGADPKFLSVQLFGRPASFVYQFQVKNLSGHHVSYQVDDKPVDLEPGVSIMHKICEPATVAFVSAGGWMSRQRIDVKFQAHDKAVFVVRAAAGAKVRIEEQK